jgi:hypothetical protein
MRVAGGARRQVAARLCELPCTSGGAARGIRAEEAGLCVQNDNSWPITGAHDSIRTRLVSALQQRAERGGFREWGAPAAVRVRVPTF